MKVLRISAISRQLVPLLACGFLLAAIPTLSASGNDPIDSVLPAAQAWIALIDAGQYDESYAGASDALHQAVTQEKWQAVLTAIRPIWGKVLSRKEASHIYQPNGIEGINGECMVITYDTSFQHVPDGFEKIVLKLEDGKWRGAGYNAGAKATPDDGSTPPPVNPTEIHTETNVKPQPQ